MNIYILDEELRLLSRGAVGELYIGGDGVGRRDFGFRATQVTFLEPLRWRGFFRFSGRARGPSTHRRFLNHLGDEGVVQERSECLYDGRGWWLGRR